MLEIDADKQVMGDNVYNQNTVGNNLMGKLYKKDFLFSYRNFTSY